MLKVRTDDLVPLTLDLFPNGLELTELKGDCLTLTEVCSLLSAILVISAFCALGPVCSLGFCVACLLLVFLCLVVTIGSSDWTDGESPRNDL